MPMYTWVPIDVFEMAVHCKVVKPLQIYLYLKISTSGKCHRDADVFIQLRKELFIKDKRTFQKHLNRLLELDWIGYNQQSGYYFIRRYDKLLKKRKRNRFACKAVLKDLKNIQALVTAVLLSDNIRRQKYYWEKKNKKKTAAASKRETANQLVYSYDSLSYYGLSNKTIGRILGCQQTRAYILKQQAEKAGYIKTRDQFKKIITIQKRDFKMRQALFDLYPRLTGRIHFKRKKEKGKWVIHVLEQKHDEIIPNVLIVKN